GIVVAALARYNPVAVVVTSFFIGMLVNAGFALQGPGFPIGLTGTMEGILLFCVLGAEIFTRYRLGFRPQQAISKTPVFPPSPAPAVVGPTAPPGEVS